MIIKEEEKWENGKKWRGVRGENERRRKVG